MAIKYLKRSLEDIDLDKPHFIYKLAYLQPGVKQETIAEYIEMPALNLVIEFDTADEIERQLKKDIEEMVFQVRNDQRK